VPPFPVVAISTEETALANICPNKGDAELSAATSKEEVPPAPPMATLEIICAASIHFHLLFFQDFPDLHPRVRNRLFPTKAAVTKRTLSS
jgi:hypothetical protein